MCAFWFWFAHMSLSWLHLSPGMPCSGCSPCLCVVLHPALYPQPYALRGSALGTTGWPSVTCRVMLGRVLSSGLNTVFQWLPPTCTLTLALREPGLSALGWGCPSSLGSSAGWWQCTTAPLGAGESCSLETWALGTQQRLDTLGRHSHLELATTGAGAGCSSADGVSANAF